MSRRSGTISMVILPVLTGCLPNMVHCNGCWCDARMMLPLSDAAWDEETPTMILTLRWEPGVVPVRVSGPSGDGPLCVSVPVSEPLAQRKRKYCFWPGPGGCRSGRAATFKVKLILNFKDQWKENGVSWKAMEIGFKNSQLPSTTARFPGYIGVHPSNHRHCHGAGRCRHQAFYSHSSSCRMNELNLLPGSDHAAGERLRDHKHIMTGSLMRLMTGLTSRHK